MNADITTVLVAVLGVFGTLVSPLFGQWTAARAKQQEFDLHHQERLEDRADTRQREVLEERRAMYARLNTTARQYAQELRAYLRVIAADAITDDARTVLNKARQAYRDCYSDAQMILPDKVLDVAISVNEGLGEAYGTVRRLENPPPGSSDDHDREDTIAKAQEYCRVTLYDLIGALRQTMREDLGVSQDG